MASATTGQDGTGSQSSRPEASRFRKLKGPMGAVQMLLPALAVFIGLLYPINIHTYIGLEGIWKEQYVGVFIALIMGSVFINIPVNNRASRTQVPWYDYILFLASFACGLYISVSYPRILIAGLQVTPEIVILGTILVFLALEGSRRLVGWTFVILTAVFIIYAAFTNIFPGLLGGRATPWPQLVTYLYLDSGSFLLTVGIAATLALTFILFGQTIFSFGGGAIMGDLALGLMGRYRGGPAKVSILGSSLFGTVSGSAISNIMVVGSITIPLMRRIGYKPAFAGAVESCASTGGMIMPPVLGIVAFLMADMTGIPYAKIAIACIIPAVLYYFALYVQVDMEAAKNGLRGLPKSELPAVMPTLKKSWVVIVPLLFLIYVLFVKALPAAMAAAYSTIFCFFLYLILKDVRRNYFKYLWNVFKDAGQVLLSIGTLLVCAGFIVAAINASGLGTKIAISLVAMGGGNVVILLIVAAVGCLILGMGMPAVAAYILVAVLVAPALVQLDISLMAAHMFVMYYANLSLITPPVALAVFVAAPMAGASVLRTGISAMRLAILAYIVPFLFVFAPPLLLKGPVWHITLVTVLSVIGTFAIGTGLAGYFFRPMTWYRRLLYVISALALFVSIGLGLTTMGIWLMIAGLAIFAILTLFEWRGRRGIDVPAQVSSSGAGDES